MSLKEIAQKLGLSPPPEKKNQTEEFAKALGAMESRMMLTNARGLPTHPAQNMNDAQRQAYIGGMAQAMQEMKKNILDDIGPVASYQALYGQMAAGARQPPDPNTLPLWTLRMANLDTPAGKATLEELADLWRTRWGTQWVKRAEIADAGEFYNIAATRLMQAGYLEAHELSDRVRVYKLCR